MTGKPNPIMQRFEAAYMPEPNSGCWLWMGSHHAKGYGFFSAKGLPRRAHRASYVLHKGPIPDGLFVCHRCDMPGCVNPDHLWLGTAAENTNDMLKKGRRPPAAVKPPRPPRKARVVRERRPRQQVKRQPIQVPAVLLIGRGKFSRAKLSDAAVRYIRANPNGASHRQLAEAFGVTSSSIGRVLHRTGYVHVTD